MSRSKHDSSLDRYDGDLVHILSKVAGLLNTTPESVRELISRGTFPPMEARLIKISQIAAWLGVSEATIYKWVRDQQFPPPVNLGRPDDPFATKRWFYSEVAEWLYGRPRGVGDKTIRTKKEEKDER